MGGVELKSQEAGLKRICARRGRSGRDECLGVVIEEEANEYAGALDIVSFPDAKVLLIRVTSIELNSGFRRTIEKHGEPSFQESPASF